MGNDVNKHPSPLPHVTLFSNFLPTISQHFIYTTSNIKFSLSIQQLTPSYIITSTSIIFNYYLSNYDIILLNTTSTNIYIFILNQRLIHDHIYITSHNNNTSALQHNSFLKSTTNECTITITPSVTQADYSKNIMNNIFDIHCLYQRGVKLNRDNNISNGVVSYSSQNLNTYGMEFYCKKSKSLKNEEDSIKGKNIDEIYEEYVKRRQNKTKKEEVTLFNQRYFKRNIIKK